MITEEHARQFLEAKKAQGVPKEQALQDLQNALSALQPQQPQQTAQPKTQPTDDMQAAMEAQGLDINNPADRRLYKQMQQRGVNTITQQSTGSNVIDAGLGILGETGEALQKTSQKLAGGIGYLAGQVSRLAPGDQSENPQKFKEEAERRTAPVEYEAPDTIGGKIGGVIGEGTGFLASELPSLAAGAGAATKIDKALKARNLFQGASTAAKATNLGLQGAGAIQAGMPLSQGRIATVDETALFGAGFSAGVPIIGKAINYFGGTQAAKGAKTATMTVMKPVRKYFEKAVQPQFRGSKKTITGRAQYMKDADKAVKTIVANKQNLQLTDEMGDAVKNQLPENLGQFEQAVHQTKREVFTQYSNLAKEHGKLPVDTQAVSSNIREIGNMKRYALSPDVKRTAEKYATYLDDVGELDIVEAEDVLQQLNSELKAFYNGQGTSSEGAALIKHIVANNIRKQLDKTISNASGVYRGLKRTYGSLAAIEKDVTHRALVEGRKAPEGFFSLSDVFTAGDLARGAAGDALSAVKGAAQAVAKRRIMTINDKNRMVRKMFQGAAQELEADDTFRTLQQQIGVARTQEQAARQASQRLLPSPEDTRLRINPEVDLTPIELPAKTSLSAKDTKAAQPIRQSRQQPLNIEDTPKVAPKTTTSQPEAVPALTRQGDIKAEQAAKNAIAKGAKQETVSIDDIKYAKRTEAEIADLRAEIRRLREAGKTDAEIVQSFPLVVVGKTGKTVDGAHRLNAFKAEGIEQVPVLRLKGSTKPAKSATMGDDISKTKMTAPKELIEEAKKYKTAEEFVNSIGEDLYVLNKEAKKYKSTYTPTAEKYNIKNKLLSIIGEDTGEIHKFTGGGYGKLYKIGDNTFHNIIPEDEFIVDYASKTNPEFAQLKRRLEDIFKKYPVENYKGDVVKAPVIKYTHETSWDIPNESWRRGHFEVLNNFRAPKRIQEEIAGIQKKVADLEKKREIISSHKELEKQFKQVTPPTQMEKGEYSDDLYNRLKLLSESSLSKSQLEDIWKQAHNQSK